MKELKIPSTQNVDVVEIMKKIRQNAALSRNTLTMEERVRRESRTEFLAMIQSAQVPEHLVEEIRQNKVFEPYDPRTLYASSRPGVGSLIGLIRKILRPITKLFINLDPLAHEVNRLSLLNNFYLQTVQDLIGKTSKMSVELHSLRRTQHHNRDGNRTRPNNNNSNRHRRGGGRYRRDNEIRNANQNQNQSSAPRPTPEEPPAQNS